MGTRSVVVLLLVACRGPDPMIAHAAASPSPLPGMTRAVIELVNDGGGHGQTRLNIDLRERRSARLVHSEHDLELEPHQRVTVTLDIATPPGDYAIEVHARYPD